MGKVYSGWKKGAIYDPATGTTVQLGKLALESTNYTEEIITTDTTQTNIYGGKTITVELGFFDDSGIAQLQAWAEADTPIQAVVSGGNNLQWYESVPLSFRKLQNADKRSGLNIFVVTLTYSSDEPAIYTNQNLMAYLGDVDSGTVIFPVDESTLTLSADATATGGAITLSLNNFADTPVSTASTTVVSTGINTASDVIESTVYNIDFNISTATVEYPALTTNGKVTNGTSFMDY